MDRYDDRLDRVRRHIAENLTGDLGLDALADVAAMSRFHWHRLWRAITGETLAETVRRARLNRAAVLVVRSAEPMARVAALCGYPNTGSFARAFRAVHGITPTAARASNRLPPPLLPPDRKDLPMIDVTLRDEPAFVVAALPHKGPYHEIGNTLMAHAKLAGETGLMPRLGPGIGLYYDDPSTVPPEELRSHAGCQVADDGALPEGFDRVEVPAGRVAVALYKGPYDGIPAAWSAAYGDWLPGSGETLADRVPFERYLNMPGEVPDDALLTEIVIPLEG